MRDGRRVVRREVLGGAPRERRARKQVWMHVAWSMGGRAQYQVQERVGKQVWQKADGRIRLPVFLVSYRQAVREQLGDGSGEERE